MTKKKAAKKPPAKKVVVNKGPRQPSLPTMSDRKIESLEDAALSYAEIRDARQQLTTQESELKQKLIALMHRLKKEVYDCGNVHIELVTEEETVKVRIKKVKAEEPEDYEHSPADGMTEPETAVAE